jgi:hypothetical protein
MSYNANCKLQFAKPQQITKGMVTGNGYEHGKAE